MPQQSPPGGVGASESINQDLITVDDSLNASLAYVQQEYSDLTLKYHELGSILQEVRNEKESLQRQAEERERRHAAEVESLKQLNQVSFYASFQRISQILEEKIFVLFCPFRCFIEIKLFSFDLN